MFPLDPGKLQSRRMIVQIFSAIILLFVMRLTQYWVFTPPATLDGWDDIVRLCVFGVELVVGPVIVLPKNPRLKHIQEEAEYQHECLRGIPLSTTGDRLATLKAIEGRRRDYVWIPLILTGILSFMLVMVWAFTQYVHDTFHI